MEAVLLKPHKDVPVKAGHPWVFSGAIQEETRNQKSERYHALEHGSGVILENGDLVRVLSSRGEFLGLGYYNANSAIRVRLLTHKDEVIAAQFFIRKISALKNLKEKFIDPEETDSYRVVYAESDDIPGLIVDKYADTLVLQSHTLGIDGLKPMIVEALRQVYFPALIYERSDVPVRAQEGLETLPTGVLYGKLDSPEIEIKENGLKLLVNIVEGQKTGYFLDQRENRRAVAQYAKGKKCANIFSYTGSFGVSMMAAGAKEVVNFDASESALLLAEKNYKLNGLKVSEHHLLQGDAFEYLTDLAAQPPAFDLIVLDPPAFAKSRKNLAPALQAYSKLNALALRALPSGGILATSSCSGSISETDFMDSLAHAAVKAGCTIRLLEKRAQPIDHGINPAFPEGAYLKFFIFVKE